MLTYSHLLEKVEKFSGALGGLDLTPESKLGIFCLNKEEYLIAYLGALLKGLPIVPFNTFMNSDHLAFIARDAQIDTLIVDSALINNKTVPFFKLFKNKILVGESDPTEFLAGKSWLFPEFLSGGEREKGFRRHSRAPNIPDTIMYTSGTTANPKGVMLDESQLHINSEGFIKALEFSSEDRFIMALPLFHSFGNITTLVAIRLGATIILYPKFSPQIILEGIGKRQATILPMVPTMFSYLLDLFETGDYDVSTLKICISGGASLPEELLRKVEKTFGATVHEGYGLTEASPGVAITTVIDGSVSGSVGKILAHVEVKIVNNEGEAVAQGEVGEIWVRGPNIMKGYWKRPEETQETLTSDGWLKTGDLGHLDAENRLYISGGRKKDLIIRGGENISPVTIEKVLLSHPGVEEASVVGIPHPNQGEQIKACVVLRERSSAGEKDLKCFCEEKLPAFMVPAIFRFYPALPKNALGKILKSQLKEG